MLTPVSPMRSFWGLMRAYWISDRWREAWGLTLIIALLTALGAKSGVWLAEASGELVNSIATFHHPDNHKPLAYLLASAGTLILIVLVKDIVFTGVRHFFSTTLHRKWRGWLNARFNDALLDANHSHLHIQHCSDSAVAPDNVDQRVQESIKGMTGGAIGLAMGIAGVVLSLFFVGQKLLETSVAIEGLEFLGDYGTVVVALLAVAVYVPFNTWIALKLGGVMERLTIRMQQAEGSYRAELTTLLRRSFHVAAARGEGVQRAMHDRLYDEIDDTWGKLNKVHAGYMSFEKVYDFVAARIVAYGPALIPYANNNISLKSYVTGAELVNSLIGQCSWFIHVMPAIATLKANARRVTDLAEAIETVQQPAEFYARSGVAEFSYNTQNAAFGVTIRNLELLHQGRDIKPFLTAADLRFKRGEWTFLRGESGCGKTSLIKAINGLWPHGRGSIILPAGVTPFYAAQEVKLPPVTLKELVCLPDRAEAYADAKAATALHKAGLGEFIEHLADEHREGRSWDQLLSGGQKEKLVLARILLQQPGLLFLDEATGALDPEAKIAFHQAIRDNCPDVTVISVMHDPLPPKSATGKEFYDSVLTVADGVASKKFLPKKPPVQVASILGEAQPVGGRRTYFPHIRLK